MLDAARTGLAAGAEDDHSTVKVRKKEGEEFTEEEFKAMASDGPTNYFVTVVVVLVVFLVIGLVLSFITTG